MKPLLFIYNPYAGKGLSKEKLPAVLSTFTQEGWLVTAYPTQGKADATEIAAQMGSQFERVVCCGGDGTLSETVSGLMTLEHPPVLGYLPAGTTNDFARNLNLPCRPEDAARTAVCGTVFPCDVGWFNEKTFLYVAAFGAFTDVSYGTPQATKNALGHLAYLLEGVTRLGSLKHYALEITHDGGATTGDFIYGMVSNTISVGGFKGLLPGEVYLDDGQFEVMLVRRPTSLAELQSILKCLIQHKTVPGGAVETFRTAQLRVACQEELPWTLDGEYGGAPETAEITIQKHAIRLVRGGAELSAEQK